MATVGRGAEQYTVRMPDGLRDRIKAAADANNRSMNAEIVSALENAFPRRDGHEDLRLLVLWMVHFDARSDEDRKFHERICARIEQALAGVELGPSEASELVSEIEAYVDERTEDPDIPPLRDMRGKK